MFAEKEADLLEKMERYDPPLKWHCIRTSVLVGQIGNALGINDKALQELRIAALIHDIGKIFIDPKILLKPGKLTPEERLIVDEHSLIGYLYALKSGYPLEIAELILLHHGYFKEKGGNSFSEERRPLADILRACDIFDAVTHDRPYHEKVDGLEGLRIVRMQDDLAGDILRALEFTAKMQACKTAF